MTSRSIALRFSLLLAVISANAEAQVPGGRDQAQLARQLLTGDGFERGAALVWVRQLGPENVGADLRAALITALEREGRLLAQRRRGEIPELENPELIAGLAHVVSAFRDPRSIPALTGALGTSPPATNALAEFGERAAPAVLDVVESTANTSILQDGMTSLRFMAESVGGQPLTRGTRDRMRRVAKKHLTAPRQDVTIIWRAIDIAVALGDPDLKIIVEHLATDRNAVAALGVTEASLIEQTQRNAAERLAGVPPLPRHTSAEEFAKRWK